MHLLIFDRINRLVSLSIIKAPIWIDGMWVVLFENRFYSLFNFKYFINIIFHLFMRFVGPMSDKSFRLVYNSFNLCVCIFFSSAKILTSESWYLLTLKQTKYNLSSFKLMLQCIWHRHFWQVLKASENYFRTNHIHSFRWAQFTHTTWTTW